MHIFILVTVVEDDITTTTHYTLAEARQTLRKNFAPEVEDNELEEELKAQPGVLWKITEAIVS